MTPLKLGKLAGGGDLTVRLDVLMKTRLLVESNSGGGKSRTLRKILETTHGHVQQVVLDLEGDFATLRERFDYVLAGKGGDVPADPRSAGLLARKILDLRVSLIVDLSELRHHDRVRFVRLFLESMIDAPRELWHPVMVVVDEAHIFAPEKGQSEAAGAVIDLATRGRKRGFCALLATQRISKLHKDAAAECLNKLIGRTGLDIDMKRAGDELGMSGHAQVLTLRDLDPGEFFAFGPAISKRVVRGHIGDVVTTHPEAGEGLPARAPAPTAKVKALLAKLTDLPKEAEEEARDAATLRLRLKEVERELRSARAEKQAPAKPDPDQRKKEDLALAAYASGKTLETCLSLASVFRKELAKALDAEAASFIEALKIEESAHTRAAAEKGIHLRPGGTVTAAAGPRPSPSQVKRHAVQSRPAPIVRDAAHTRVDFGLGRGPKEILKFLALREGKGFTKAQLAPMTGFANSGTFGTYLSQLVTAGLVSYKSGLVSLEDGASSRAMEILGPEYHAPEKNALEEWLGRLGEGPKRIYAELLQNPDTVFPKEELAERTGFANSGTFGTYVSKLSTLGLAERSPAGIRLNPEILGL